MVQGTPVYDDTRHLVETVEAMVPKSCQRKLVANDQFPCAMLSIVNEDVESKACKTRSKCLKKIRETHAGLCFWLLERSNVYECHS